MLDLVQVSYHSLATPYADTSRAGLEALLRVARQRNRSCALTGALLYGEGRFAQILEGPRDAVQAVMDSICRDRRHGDVTLLQNGRVIKQRAFENWAMAGLVWQNGFSEIYPILLGLDVQTRSLSGDSLLAVLRWVVEGQDSPAETLPEPARQTLSGARQLVTMLH